MCRHATLTLPPAPSSARRARTFIGGELQRWGVPELVDTARLAVSELVTNGVLHAGTELHLTASLSGGCVEVSLRDDDPRPAAARPLRKDLLADLRQLMRDEELVERVSAPASPGAGDARDAGDAGGWLEERRQRLRVGASGSVVAGRGLLIIDAISDEWGVATRALGKEVWLTLRVPSAWPHLTDCLCGDPDYTSTAATAGGRRVIHNPGPWDITAV